MPSHTSLFKSTNQLSPNNPAYRSSVYDKTIKAVLEDLYPQGDITTKIIYGNENHIVTATIIAKENCILAGIEEILWFLEICKKEDKKKLFTKLKVISAKKDGEKIKKGEEILKLQGSIQFILSIERTILNLLQRMSGIATETSKIYNLCYKDSCRKDSYGNNQTCLIPRIACTRKTPWGLLDKKAVEIGGGWSHRLNLSDAIMIKDTHLDPFRRKNLDKIIEKSIAEISKQKNNIKFFEIEVINKEEAIQTVKILKQQIKNHKFKIPIIIMLDNFSPKEIIKTFKELKKENFSKDILFEASGGISEKNIKEYAKTEVNIISLGYLTHSVRAIDLSMKIMSTLNTHNP